MRLIEQNRSNRDLLNENHRKQEASPKRNLFLSRNSDREKPEDSKGELKVKGENEAFAFRVNQFGE